MGNLMIKRPRIFIIYCFLLFIGVPVYLLYGLSNVEQETIHASVRLGNDFLKHHGEPHIDLITTLSSAIRNGEFKPKDELNDIKLKANKQLLEQIDQLEVRWKNAPLYSAPFGDPSFTIRDEFKAQLSSLRSILPQKGSDYEELYGELAQIEAAFLVYEISEEDKQIDCEKDFQILSDPFSPSSSYLASLKLMEGWCEEGGGNLNKAKQKFIEAKGMVEEGRIGHYYLDNEYGPGEYQRSSRRPPVLIDGYFSFFKELLLFQTLFSYLKREDMGHDDFKEPSYEELVGEGEGRFLFPHLSSPLFHPITHSEEGLISQMEDQYKNKGFAVLDHFLHPVEIMIMRSYYHQLFITPTRSNENHEHDSFDDNLGRTSSYNDRIGMYMNDRLFRIASYMSGEKLKPSYSFLCHYEDMRKGINKNQAFSTLKPHTDREDNDYTLSIQISSLLNDELETVPSLTNHHFSNIQWPIYVHKQITIPPEATWRDKPSKDESVECGMEEGDALFFRGRTHIHWRDQQSVEVHHLTSILFHFVKDEMDLFDYKIRQLTDTTI